MRFLHVLADQSADLRGAAYLFVIALLSYLTWWLRSHIGKSNGKGPLNRQMEQALARLERIEKGLGLPPIEDEATDEEGPGA